ncbi:MAG: non-homologous end-joining DNA ligase [Acidobacteriota bacterium]|nr:non-homologous end-joining DNA ligase [Acidobacteriota bacterium]
MQRRRYVLPGSAFVPISTVKASFVEPMLCLATSSLPEGPEWEYELKLDGYRALAIKTGRAVQLRSRNNKDLGGRFSGVVGGLAALPGETVIDGEVVALDDSGRPSFNTLQNYAAGHPIFYYAFDLLIFKGRDLRSQLLAGRRELLRSKVLSKLGEPIRYSPTLDGSLHDLIASVRQQKFEGLIAKRADSAYESGERSGAWLKMRVNQGQEFVIGGYTPTPKNLDALVLGYYEGDRLIYVARTRNGFTPALREHLFRWFRGLEIKTCPFANLPEAHGGRWGQGFTAAKMQECRWLRPVLVGQFEFAEWTPDNHLRHSRFVALREDKEPKAVHRNIGNALGAKIEHHAREGLRLMLDTRTAFLPSEQRWTRMCIFQRAD